jgi:hypothetical protein
LVSLKLNHATVDMELVNGLAQLPSLQRLHLHSGKVEEQIVGAWTALRSLHEIQLDCVAGANRLLPVLSSLPLLRLLRWRCKPPWYAQRERQSPALPQLEPLGQLLTTAPLFQVELVMQRTFDAWLHAWSTVTVSDELMNYQRRVWDDLRQLPTQLPRALLVDVEADD